MFILVHKKVIVTNEDTNICRKQEHFWSVLHYLLMNPQILGRICCCWAGKTLCWGHTPYAHRETAPSAKAQAGAPACATQSTDFTLLARTHGTGEAKFLPAHALLKLCSLAVLDTHWPAQPGLLVWPKPTLGQAWVGCASFKQQIHDLHLVDQWLERELPSNFTVQSLHTQVIFMFGWLAKCEGFMSLEIRHLRFPLRMVHCQHSGLTMRCSEHHLFYCVVFLAKKLCLHCHPQKHMGFAMLSTTEAVFQASCYLLKFTVTLQTLGQLFI